MPDKIVPLWKVVGEVSETTFLDPPNTQYKAEAEEQGSMVGIWQDRTAVATLSFAGRDRRSVVAKWR